MSNKGVADDTARDCRRQGVMRVTAAAMSAVEGGVYLCRYISAYFINAGRRDMHKRSIFCEIIHRHNGLACWVT